MPNQELLSYIKKQLDKNISKDVVRQALLKAGWPIVDIESAFLELEKRIKTSSVIKSDTQLTPQQEELKEMVKANPDYYHFEKRIEQKPITNFQDSGQSIKNEEKNIEKIFNHGIAKSEPQKTFSQTLKPEPNATAIKKNDLPKTRSAIKGIMLGMLAFAISAFSVYLYIFWTEISDPMFLVPSNNDAIVVLNTNLASPQWIKTRELINRIPFGAKTLDELAKNGLLTGSIKQIIGFANIDTTKGGVLIEFSSEIDSKAIQSLKDFLNTTLSATEETEKYQNFEIKKILKDSEVSSLFNSGKESAEKVLVGAYVQLGNKVAFSNDIEQIRLIIGNYKKANLANVFSKGSIKGIKSASSFKKLKKYIPKEYLLWGYANIDLKNLDPVTLEKNIKGFELKDALLASLSDIKTSTSNGALFYVLANDNGFISKQFAVGDLTSVMDDFDTSKSLAQNTNSQIGDKEMVLYSEIKNLSKYFKELEKQQSSSYQIKADYVFDMIKENIGIDIAQIIDDVNGQANISVYYDRDIIGTPSIFANVKIQSSNASQIDKVLSEVNIKDASAETTMKMNDSILMSYMSQIITQAEIYNSEKGFYPYYLGSSLEIKELSETIKEYTPDQSTIVFNSSGAKYCAYAKLNADDSYYCIDASGASWNFSFDKVSQSCKKGIYQCPLMDEQKEKIYTVQSNQFSDIGVGDIKALPILSDNILLGYSTNDNVIDFVIGSKADIESFANANMQKVSDMQEYKDTIGNNKNIKSVILFKPKVLIDIFMRELSGTGEYKNGLIEIFPLISGVSYVDKDVLISDSQIRIKDIGKDKIKEIENIYGTNDAQNSTFNENTTSTDSTQTSSY